MHRLSYSTWIFATIQFNYICVYLFISSETQVRRIHNPFELVFIPVSAPEVSHCSGNRISVSSGKGLNLLTNNVFLLLKYDDDPFFQISPFFTIIADVSSQFSTSQLCNVIVLAARLMRTLFGRQIVISKRKKIVKENLPGAKVDYLYF